MRFRGLQLRREEQGNYPHGPEPLHEQSGTITQEVWNVRVLRLYKSWRHALRNLCINCVENQEELSIPTDPDDQSTDT